MIHSSNVVLRALLGGNEPNGSFGPPGRQKAVDPNQLKLPYHDYLALMLELRDIVQDLEPDLQFACDKLELVQTRTSGQTVRMRALPGAPERPARRGRTNPRRANRPLNLVCEGKMIAQTLPEVDLDHLLKLRLVVARHARWTGPAGGTTTGAGPARAIVLQRGFPRTHFFAQARVVFAVARSRSQEVFNPPGCARCGTCARA